MNDIGKERESEFVDSLIRAFGSECVYHSPQMRKANGQQKELADAMILVPPYAVVFQLKWMHQTAEDFYGANQEIERGRLWQKMVEAAKQFNRLNATWRRNSRIELPQIWNGGKKTFTLDLSLIKFFIPVVVVDFEDQQYTAPGARTNVCPVVTKIPDAIKDWGMVHCFLFRDFNTILADLFTPGDLITYLFLREKQIMVHQKFLNYSELDFFALYLTKYPEWNRSINSPMLVVEPNYYEALIRDRADDFAKRREFFRNPDFLDEIVSQMCVHFQNKFCEAFLLNLGRIRGLPALIKKSIGEHVNINREKLECPNINITTTTQISMGRFATMIFPNTLYLIGSVICESKCVETVTDYLYRRALSYIVEKGWQSDIQDVFMIIQGVPNRWTFAGGCTVNADDYDRCLTKVEIEKSRVSFDIEPFNASEWSYLRQFQEKHVVKGKGCDEV